MSADGATDVYDEFAFLRDNAAEAGLPWVASPDVRRIAVPLDDGRHVSALRWGRDDAEIVLVHGGGQNAHTYDTVALALRRSLVAIDLPGHGHSSWRDDWDYRPRALAPDLAAAIRAVAPHAELVAGMSLGGLTAMAVAGGNPELVGRLALIDITPGVKKSNGTDVRAIYQGPASYASVDEMAAHVASALGTRANAALSRGVLHNARRRADGRWVWRHHRSRQDVARPEDPDFTPLWVDLEAVTAPVLLVHGARSRIVGSTEAREFGARLPAARVVEVPRAGHSVQSDQPLELARLLEAFLQDRMGVDG